MIPTLTSIIYGSDSDSDSSQTDYLAADGHLVIVILLLGEMGRDPNN